jgi:hypothetical protein
MAVNETLLTDSIPVASPSTRLRRLPYGTRMVQNFHLVWLDRNIDETSNDMCRNFITNFQQIVNTVNTFIDVDECIDFIMDIEEQVFMIISKEFSEIISPIVQDISQINLVYILCDNSIPHENSARQSVTY